VSASIRVALLLLQVVAVAIGIWLGVLAWNAVS